MKTIEIVMIDGGQTVKLPDEYRFREEKVSIRREGEAVILEPIKSTTWPTGFFEAIRIDDPALNRPEQGNVPPAPAIDAS